MSKLAALAAKRRQKESERSESSATDTTSSKDDYTASLNKLRISHTTRTEPSTQRTDASDASSATLESESHDQKQEQNNKTEQDRGEATGETPDLSVAVDTNIRARPSAFASIMTSHDRDRRLSSSQNLLPVNDIAKSFDFTEPSPDDVVTKAQNPKGRN